MTVIAAEGSASILDPARRSEIICRYLPLVRGIARRFRYRGEELDDLVQVGTIGLIAAVDRFRPERGGDFAAFAVPTISGEIQRHLRDRVGTVRLPRGLHELRGRIPALQRELAAQLGRIPTTDELARAAGVAPEDVARVLAYQPAAELEEEPGQENPADSADDRLFALDALRLLDGRRRTILHLHYYAGLSQSEIGRRLGLSQIHVSRLLRSGLDELHARLEGQP